MIERRLTLPPEWVSSGPDGNRTFQSLVRDISDIKEEALILHAPTGAGKTHALRLWLDRHAGGFREQKSLLVVTPTNALAAEIQRDLSTHLGDEHQVLRWTARDLHDRHGAHLRHSSVFGEAQSAALIVTNPDNLHRFTNHAFTGPRDPSKWPPKLRPAWRSLETTGLVVVDEYHAYEEPLLASILLLLLKLRSAQEPVRFLFMSATPSEALCTLLNRLGVSFNIHNVQSQPEADGDPIKHKMEVTITNAPLFDAVKSLDRSRRTLVVFDQFTDLLRLGTLQGEHDVTTITGRGTRRLKGGKAVGEYDFSSAKLLLATSKVDVGLNIPDVERFHIQPGFRLQQSWQRFGRAGRDGPADITIHLDQVGDGTLSQYHPETKEDLENMLAAFLKEHRTNVLRVQEWMARFLAYYHHNTPDQHAHRTIDIDQIATEHPVAKKHYFQTLKLLQADFPGRTSGGPWDERRWQKEVGLALARLRGDQLQVEVHYPDFHRDDDETSKEDLAYILRWTEYRLESRDDRPVHVVTRVRDSPQNVLLHYPVYGCDQCPIPARGTVPDRQYWRSWTYQLATNGQFQTREFRETLAEWIEACGPGTIHPLEAMADDQII